MPLYIYAGLIFYLSSQSRVLPCVRIPNLDKVLHLCEYTLFGYLAARAFKNAPKTFLRENFKAMAVLASLIYGIPDEYHQLFVPGREFSVFDMLADGIGGVVGVVVYLKHTNYH